MEPKNIAAAIPQKMGTAKFKDPYAHIVLTEEETEFALRKARQEKAVAIKTKEYLAQISQPKQYRKFTLQEFKDEVLNKIRTKIPDYVLDDYNSHIFHLSALYYLRDPEFETIDGGRYKLNKGLAYLGPIGCGKTSMAQGFNVNPTNSYAIVSCRTVAEEYSMKDGGALAIKKFSGLREVPPYDFFDQRFIGTLFDDLGTENAKKHFGNESNVMEEIFLNRYDVHELNAKTHLTTNLSADQIEEFYGPRVRSRLRQMCNFLMFNPKGADRRK